MGTSESRQQFFQGSKGSVVFQHLQPRSQQLLMRDYGMEALAYSTPAQIRDYMNALSSEEKVSFIKRYMSSAVLVTLQNALGFSRLADILAHLVFNSSTLECAQVFEHFRQANFGNANAAMRGIFTIRVQLLLDQKQGLSDVEYENVLRTFMNEQYSGLDGSIFKHLLDAGLPRFMEVIQRVTGLPSYESSIIRFSNLLTGFKKTCFFGFFLQFLFFFLRLSDYFF